MIHSANESQDKQESGCFGESDNFGLYNDSCPSEKAVGQQGKVVKIF